MHILEQIRARKAIVKLLRKFAGFERLPGGPEIARSRYLELLEKVDRMNVKQYEQAIRAEADQLHEQAGRTDDPEAYRRAGALYERCGEFETAAACYRQARELDQL